MQDKMYPYLAQTLDMRLRREKKGPHLNWGPEKT